MTMRAELNEVYRRNFIRSSLTDELTSSTSSTSDVSYLIKPLFRERLRTGHLRSNRNLGSQQYMYQPIRKCAEFFASRHDA